MEPGTARITFVTDSDPQEQQQEQEGRYEDQEPNEQRHESDDTVVLDRSKFTVPIPITMPDMGNGDQNKVIKWYKQPGDIIKRNDILCDIETPDFTFGMVTEDEFDSIMGDIVVEAGPTPIPDHTIICQVWHQEEPGGEDKQEK